MILTAFDVKFHETKNELPPKACRPPRKFQKFKKMDLEMGPPPARPPERGVRGAQPPGRRKKRVKTW